MAAARPQAQVWVVPVRRRCDSLASNGDTSCDRDRADGDRSRTSRRGERRVPVDRSHGVAASCDRPTGFAGHRDVRRRHILCDRDGAQPAQNGLVVDVADPVRAACGLLAVGARGVRRRFRAEALARRSVAEHRGFRICDHAGLGELARFGRRRRASPGSGHPGAGPRCRGSDGQDLARRSGRAATPTAAGDACDQCRAHRDRRGRRLRRNSRRGSRCARQSPDRVRAVRSGHACRHRPVQRAGDGRR